MIITLADERITRFRRALERLAAAIDNAAPRSTLDILQTEVCRYRVPGIVGDAIITQEEFRR